MPAHRLAIALLIVASAPVALFAADAPAPAPLTVDSQALANTLRGLLLSSLPDPIVTTQHNWDHQKEVMIGMKWHRTGRLRFKPEAMKGLRNDGLWQRVRVEAIDPAKTLALGVGTVTHREDGAAVFDASMVMDTRIYIDQQLWKSGARIFGGTTRLRCHAALKLVCEVTNRIERKPGAVLPDVVMRVRVTQAELYYTDLVCEHVLGMEGKPAEKIGEVAYALLKEFKPSLEQELLAKANAAIVKAADTKEVRIELDRFLKLK